METKNSNLSLNDSLTNIPQLNNIDDDDDNDEEEEEENEENFEKAKFEEKRTEEEINEVEKTKKSHPRISILTTSGGESVKTQQRRQLRFAAEPQVSHNFFFLNSI